MRSTTTWPRFLFYQFIGVLAIASLSCSCDGLVDARFQILSTEGWPLSDALVCHPMTEFHDRSSFSGPQGCAHIQGTVAPHFNVPVTIDRADYRSLELEVEQAEGECFLVHLAPEGTDKTSSVRRVEPEKCPCANKSGYLPMMSARIQVSGTDGVALELVEARRSDGSRMPFAQVTDEGGCVGLNWVVASHLDRIPLVLEKSGFQKAYVEVPVMHERCYSVVLSRLDETTSDVIVSVVSVPEDECPCKKDSGGDIFEP